MNRYIGWALLTAFFFGIHLSADEAIKISARPAVIPAKRIRAAESDRQTERDELHARVGSRRLGVLPEQHDRSEGASAARSYFFMVKDRQEVFDVRARVLRSDNTEVMGQTSIIVVGRDGSDE